MEASRALVFKRCRCHFVEADSPDQSGVPSDDSASDSHRAGRLLGPSNPPNQGRSVSLIYNTEEARSLDPDNLVPTLLLGSYFVLTKEGARCIHPQMQSL